MLEVVFSSRNFGKLEKLRLTKGDRLVDKVDAIFKEGENGLVSLGKLGNIALLAVFAERINFLNI